MQPRKLNTKEGHVSRGEAEKQSPTCGRAGEEEVSAREAGKKKSAKILRLSVVSTLV